MRTLNVLKCIALAGCLLLSSTAAFAQDGPPKTYPQDFGYDAQGDVTARLPGGPPVDAPVDRRDEVDAFAHQGAVFSSAHVPEKGSVIYSNHLFYGHQLRYVPRERFILSGLVVLSPRNIGFSAGADSDFFGGLTGKVELYRTRDLGVSMQVGGLFRSGRYPVDTRELGGRLDALLDYKVSDFVVLIAGLNGYLPFWAGVDELDVSECATREEFFEGGCIQANPQSLTMPAGGRFLLGYLGAIFYSSYGLNFKTEVFTAVSGGSILGIEGSVYNTDDIETQTLRIEGDGSIMVGPTTGSPLGANLSIGYSRKGFGAQLALIVVPRTREMVDNRAYDLFPHFFPMSSLGYKF